MNQNNIFESIEEELQNSNLSRKEKVQLIQQVGDSYRNQVQKEYENYRNKQIAAGVLEIGSAAIPMGGVTGAIGKKLAPKVIPYVKPIIQKAFTKDVSRKITNDLANGVFVKAPEILHKKFGHKIPDDILKNTISGISDGAIYGLGESLEKETNPLSTMAISAASGGLLGGVTSGISANIAKHIQGNNLKNYPTSEIFGSNYKDFRKNAENYYKAYIQDRIIKHNEIGDIHMTRKGMDETISRAPLKAQEFPNLTNNLKQSNYIETNNLYKQRKDQATKEFLTLNSDNNQYLIAKDKKGTQKFYLNKTDTIGQGTPSNLEGTSSNGILNLASAHPIQTRALETKSNDIIKDSIKNFNTKA